MQKLSHIHAGDAGGNIADNFVTNRAKLFRHVIRRVGVAIQQDNFVAKLHVWNIRHINEHLIHADTTNNWRGMTMDEHTSFVGKQAVITVFIACR